MERIYIVGELVGDISDEDAPMNWVPRAFEPFYAEARSKCTTENHFILSFETGKQLEEGFLDMEFPLEPEANEPRS